MYSNAGKLIKKYAQIIVVLNYVLAGVIAVVIFAMGIASGDIATVFLSLFVALLVFVLSCLAAWVWGLFVYANGEMAERLLEIDQTTVKILRICAQDNAAKKVTPKDAEETD